MHTFDAAGSAAAATSLREKATARIDDLADAIVHVADGILHDAGG